MENKKKSKQKSTVSMFIYLLSSIKEHNWTFCLAVSTCLHSANLGEYHWTKLISVKWNTLNEFKYLLSQMETVIYVHTVKKTFKSAFKIMTTAGSWQDLALLFPHWILLKKKKKMFWSDTSLISKSELINCVSPAKTIPCTWLVIH